MMGHPVYFLSALGVVGFSLLMPNAGLAQQSVDAEIPALPMEQIFVFENGCKSLGELDPKDLSLKPKQYPAKWTGECRNGLAHGNGTLVSQSNGRTYSSNYTLYFGRFEQQIFPEKIGVNNDRYIVVVQNVEPNSKRAPEIFPPDPAYAALLAVTKPELIKYTLEHSVLQPFITIKDKQTNEEHGLQISFFIDDRNLVMTHKINGKDTGRRIKCSSYDAPTACSREWNAQIDAFWKKAQPLYDRALADAIAQRDAKRRQIDVLMEPMRVALGQTYSGAPFTAEELAWAQQMRDARAAKMAVFLQAETQKEQQALAAAEQKAVADKQRKAMLDAEAGQRREAFAATPKAKAAGVTLAAKSFTAPADTASVAVMLISDSENSRFDLDTGLLELPTGTDPIYVGPNDQLTIDKEVAKLKTEGVKTLYVVDLTRWQEWSAPISAKISNAQITVSTSVRDNPEYPQLVEQLKVARQELAVAKAEYDRTSATANSGGYGTSTAGVVTGIFAAVSDGSRYSDAQTKVARLEESIRRTDPKIRTTTTANVGFADSQFHSIFSGRVAVAACDLTLARCAERERVIESEITVERPLVLVEGDPDYARRSAVEKSAVAELQKTRDTSGQVGFSTAAMGKYIDGLPMFVPIANLAAWHSFAFDDFNKRFNQRNAEKVAANTMLAKQLSPVAVSLNGIKFSDPTGAIRSAAEIVATEERRKNVQGLE